MFSFICDSDGIFFNVHISKVKFIDNKSFNRSADTFPSFTFLCRTRNSSIIHANYRTTHKRKILSVIHFWCHFYMMNFNKREESRFLSISNDRFPVAWAHACKQLIDTRPNVFYYTQSFHSKHEIWHFSQEIVMCVKVDTNWLIDWLMISFSFQV